MCEQAGRSRCCAPEREERLESEVCCAAGGRGEGGAQRRRGDEGFKLGKDEAGVEVDVGADGDNGDAAVFDAQEGEGGAGEGGWLETLQILQPS